MHLPKAVADPSTKCKKNYVKLLNQSGVFLEEYGVTESENMIKCLVGTSAGDSLTVEYQIPSGEKAIVDLVVDGIICGRNITRKGTKTSRGSFSKALCCDWSDEQRTKRRKLQACDMVVQERTKSEYVGPQCDGILQSGLGTIAVRILRKATDTPERVAYPRMLLGGPTFEERKCWQYSREVGQAIRPRFEISFANSQDAPESRRKDFKEDITEHYVWATFTFLYHHVADLALAGVVAPSLEELKKESYWSTSRIGRVECSINPEPNRAVGAIVNNAEAFSDGEIEGSGSTNANRTDTEMEDSFIKREKGEGLQLSKNEKASSEPHADTRIYANITSVIKPRANSFGVTPNTIEVDSIRTAGLGGEAPLASIKGMGIADMFRYYKPQDYPESEHSMSPESSEPLTERDSSEISKAGFLKWLNSANQKTTGSHTEYPNVKDTSRSKGSLTSDMMACAGLSTATTDKPQLYFRQVGDASGHEGIDEVFREEFFTWDVQQARMGQKVDPENISRAISPQTPTLSDTESGMFIEDNLSKPLIIGSTPMNSVLNGVVAEPPVIQSKLRTESNLDPTAVQALNESTPVEHGEGLEKHSSAPTKPTKHQTDLDETDVSKKRKIDMQPDISTSVDRASSSPLPSSHGERDMSLKKLLEEKACRKRAAKETLLKARLEKEAFMKKIAEAEAALARRLAEEEEELSEIATETDRENKELEMLKTRLKFLEE